MHKKNFFNKHIDKKVLTSILATVGVLLIICCVFLLMKVDGRKDISNRIGRKPGSFYGLTRGGIDRSNSTNSFTGKIKAISEGVLVIENDAVEIISLKINGSTPVLLLEEVGRRSGQVANLEISDDVSVKYDKNSKEAYLISVNKIKN